MGQAGKIKRDGRNINLISACKPALTKQVKSKFSNRQTAI